MELAELEQKLKSLLDYEKIYGSTLAEFDRNLLQKNKARLQREIEKAKEDQTK